MPAHAVLSAISRDEFLNLVIRTKEGDKAGSNQPPARDLVHFKLQLTPEFLNSYLENTSRRSSRCRSPYPRRVRAQSFQNFSRKATLKLQDQLSRHHRCKILDQRHLRYARRSKSTNQRVSSKPQPCPAQVFTTVAIHWLVNLDRRPYLKCVQCRSGKKKLSNVRNLSFSDREKALPPSREISELTFVVKKSTMKLSGVSIFRE